jgi:hypothetical protein
MPEKKTDSIVANEIERYEACYKGKRVGTRRGASNPAKIGAFPSRDRNSSSEQHSGMFCYTATLLRPP